MRLLHKRYCCDDPHEQIHPAKASKLKVHAMMKGAKGATLADIVKAAARA